MRRRLFGLGASGVVALLVVGFAIVTAGSAAPAATPVAAQVDAANGALTQCDALSKESQAQQDCARPVLEGLTSPLSAAVGTDDFAPAASAFVKALTLTAAPDTDLNALAKDLPLGGQIMVSQPTIENAASSSAGETGVQSNPGSGPIVCVVKAGYRAIRNPEIPTFTDCNLGVEMIAQASRILRDYGGPFQQGGADAKNCIQTNRCAATAKSSVATGRFFGAANATVYFPITYNPQIDSGNDQTPTFLVH